MPLSITPGKPNSPINTDRATDTHNENYNNYLTNYFAKIFDEGLSQVGNTPISIPNNLIDLTNNKNYKNIVDSSIELDATSSIHEQPREVSASFKNIQQDLNKLKNELGGSPNFDGKEPKLQLNKKFLGIPIDTVRDFFSKGVQQGWHPSFVWEALSSAFGTGKEGRTCYEFASLSLQRYGIVKDNIENIRADFNNPFLSDQDLKDSFAKLSGFLIHIQLNGRDASLKTIENQLDILDSLYEKAKNNGTLEEFFRQAFEARACFEDRMDAFQAYAMTHLDESARIDLNKMKDYTQDSSKDRVLGEELKEFLQNNPEATASEFKTYLMETVNVTNIKAKDYQSNQATTITEEEVNIFIQQQVDYYTINEDANFIAS